jgi:hypothetical protein
MLVVRMAEWLHKVSRRGRLFAFRPAERTPSVAGPSLSATVCAFSSGDMDRTIEVFLPLNLRPPHRASYEGIALGWGAACQRRAIRAHRKDRCQPLAPNKFGSQGKSARLGFLFLSRYRPATVRTLTGIGCVLQADHGRGRSRHRAVRYIQKVCMADISAH